MSGVKNRLRKATIILAQYIYGKSMFLKRKKLILYYSTVYRSWIDFYFFLPKAYILG